MAKKSSDSAGGKNEKLPQESIRTTPLGRMAALSGAGARVGINYLKHYGRSVLEGSMDDARRQTLKTDLQERNAEAVYETFSKLKGGPLKLAQMLSIDKSLLPPAFARQFAQAYSSVPPLSYPLVVKTFLREFGKEPLEIFDQFGREAAHGASIGQVHRASRGGKEYAVKVQYPGVAQSLRSDLMVIKPLALTVLGLKEADVELYFREVETRLLEETDYKHELARSQELTAASAHITRVQFPSYHPELSSQRILTSDWIDGVSIDRFADGSATQKERDQIGQALWDFYSHQVHELLTFHADPHPGNFLVHDGYLFVLDFGCTKKISNEFYQKQFRFLDPALLSDATLLETALRDLGVILADDEPEKIAFITELSRTWLQLLARPFREGSFDFGEPSFLQSIYELGEENRQADQLRSMGGQRGSPDAIYVNRAFFGLYSLLGRIRARVEVSLPARLNFLGTAGKN